MATAKDCYRKPSSGMWDYFVDNLNGDPSMYPIDKKQSFFVGDAAGRISTNGRIKDFSCDDRKFAANIGLKFHTPEEYFDGDMPDSIPWDWEGVDPQTIIDFATVKKIKPYLCSEKELTPSHQEMIIMVGMPASGKSSFVKKYLLPKGYVHINRDKLKKKEKCLSLARQSISESKSVVIDNTNPDKSTRGEYIKIAKEYDLPVRCFVLSTPRKLADHLNAYRERITNGEVGRIPDIAYNMFQSKYEEPSEKEGFVDIMKVNFVPEFDTEEKKMIFLQWS
eukprot:TRINITY_DN4884_c0_g1_i4.p2 TRINITY_DN4884_c0_g1~~TRINITY_DN4884_c0_g1_i4.p2  ORF type:complete len:279 (-),score=78.49 TRINITY_DN4884_c0_g1_i4:27-863(-)